ncbi:MAG: helix-turn-helix domain-containing protein [Halorientalis sp.]
MSVLAVYAVPFDAFLLGETLGRYDADVTLEAVVPAAEAVIPYLWVRDAADGVLDAISSDPTVLSMAILDETEDGTLLKLTWRRSEDDLLSRIARSSGSILDGGTDGSGWRLRLRFPSQDQLRAFDRGCRGCGLSPELLSLHDPNTPEDDSLLTPAQYDTLRLALALGYFEVPRETTLDELAGELGVSDTAVSQRLRRGVRRLVADAVETV